MWLKISEEVYLPTDGLVGFFAPGVLGGEKGEGARAFALMRDGAVLPMPFKLKSLAARFALAANRHTTAKTGE